MYVYIYIFLLYVIIIIYIYILHYIYYIQKIAPSEPVHSGRRTGVTGSFIFDENI